MEYVIRRAAATVAFVCFQVTSVNSKSCTTRGVGERNLVTSVVGDPFMNFAFPQCFSCGVDLAGAVTGRPVNIQE
ncbi:hypothetical protein B0H11DRAFT_154729 [Mycena galericulata]|nr:hypothetical protein B0H11DRAFT_154729 [Mycena galericulata]